MFRVVLLNYLLWGGAIVGIVLWLWWMTSLQMSYARVNYPKSWRWRAKLFAPGAFLGFVVLFVIFLIHESPIDLRSLAILLPLMSIFGGVLSAWGFPIRMQYIIPRRREH